MRLYTRQHKHSLYELERCGRIINKEIYVRLHMAKDADYFSERYRIFVQMAEKRLPRPADSDYPIWCGISKQTALVPDEEQVLYCLNVPDDHLILFDGLKWDYVLNYLYVPLNDADNATFQQDVKALGVSDSFQFFYGRYAHLFPAMEERIANSWERIFTIDSMSPIRTQANLWEIRQEWIEAIIHPGESLQTKTASFPDYFGE
ncbi:MAG: DUF3841 domain-containing protein [Aerococcus sp.]|nr:DUF3841 domain-containing protein [Aerococcus sp.]